MPGSPGDPGMPGSPGDPATMPGSPGDPATMPPGPPALSAALGRNIAAMARRRAEHDAGISGGVKLSAGIGRVIGQMAFVYAHLAVLAAWIVVNLGLIGGIRPFDPHFNLLGTIASVEAIFVTIFILITQNHQATADDRRDELNLQISLLAEHELSQLIKLTIAMAGKLGIDTHDSAIVDLQHDIRPDEVLDTIQRAEDARSDQAI